MRFRPEMQPWPLFALDSRCRSDHFLARVSGQKNQQNAPNGSDVNTGMDNDITFFGTTMYLALQFIARASSYLISLDNMFLP